MYLPPGRGEGGRGGEEDGGLESLDIQEGGWQKREGGVFERG